ncbi:hypothetical protein F4678DRAFT_390610 [Xylaria arbuscula]|nr:hypothetical protein F4678DRAFT_390610 [Xylaria arbuscula]
MNFIRTSLLGRAPVEGGSELHRQETIDVEAQTRNSRTPFTIARPRLHSLFAGRPSWGTRGQISDEGGNSEDAPKSPALNRFRLPILTRPGTQDVPEEGVQDGESPSQRRLRTRTQRFPVLARPPPARTHEAQPDRHVRRSRFGGSDPAELRLLAENGGRQRVPHQSSSRGHRRKEPPKKFLFCFPWVKSRRARALILRCFVSGAFLISMLTIYLSLSITKNINTSEFSILLILLIILTTVFFCHALVLLCLQLVRPRTQPSGTNAESSRYGHPGYAIPREPIRVVLARDEEAAGIESEVARMKPPAYGLWRESVRVDPDRIYWQRAKSPPANDDNHDEGGHRPTQRRPPSYASDDGIEYVVDARPRSIAPPSSSIYSQGSTIDSPMASSDAPPLPRPPVAEITGPRVVGRPGNWLIV